MMITWDEPKRLKTLAERGLDFADVTLDFFATATILGSRDGRYKAVGVLGGAIIIAVVFKPLGSEALSIISMRRASAKERQQSEA